MLNVVIALIGTATLMVVLAFFRLKTAAERIVAVDALSACALAACLVAAELSGQSAFLDVAVGFALIAFLATIGWARSIAATVDRRDET